MIQCTNADVKCKLTNRCYAASSFEIELPFDRSRRKECQADFNLSHSHVSLMCLSKSQPNKYLMRYVL